MSKDPNHRQAAALSNQMGQIGCLTGAAALITIGIAFGIGWLLDSLFGNEKQIFTVIFLLASFPVTMYIIVRLSFWIMGRTQETTEQINEAEKENSDS